MSKGITTLNRSLVAIIVGFIVELFAPAIEPHFFRYPMNIIIMMMVVVAVVMLFTQYRDSRVALALRSRTFSISLIGAFAFFALLIGVIPQDGFMQRVDDGGILRALGLFNITSSYPFVITSFLMLLPLMGVVVQHITRRTTYSVMLWTGHLGLWFIISAALFGAADYNENQVTITEGDSAGMGIDSSGQLSPLGFKIKLERFIIDYYDEGVAKHFASEVEVDGEFAVIEVNRPLRRGSYFIYQTGYELARKDHGTKNSTTLKVVHDPYVWVWYVGVVMLVISALLMFVKNIKFRDGV